MADKWVKLSLSGSTAPLEAAATGIESATTAITTALGIQKSLLQIISTLLLDILNVEALLIKAALAAIEAVLDQFILDDAKIHILVVPMQRQRNQRLQSDVMMPYDDDSWLDTAAGDPTRKALNDALARVAHADTGNAGFARVVIESLNDDTDANAPRYDEDNAIFAQVFLAGAQTIVGIADILRFLESLLGVGLKGNKMLPDGIMVTPQDFKATPIAAPNSSRIGTLLEWQNPSPLQTLADYDGAFVRAQEIAIIRSTDDEALTAKSWADLFGTEQPTALTDTDKDDVAGTTASAGHRVIRRLKFSSPVRSWVDDDENLQKGRDYYYAVAFRYGISDPPGDDGKLTYTTLDYHAISNVVKVRVNDNVPSTRKGVKPDWHASPSPLDLIPDLKFFLALVKAYVASLQPQTSGAKAAVEAYIKFLEAEITRYNDFATEVAGRIKKLARLLQIPAAGVYTTSIAASEGGNDAFVQELVRRLTDETDSSAPPFFRNGFTAGIVIVAGAPNPAALAPIKTLVSLLFGTNPVLTAFEQAVSSIDQVLAQLEQKTFGDDMQLGTEPAKTTESKTFNDAMEPVSADSADANVPFDP